MLNDPFVDKVSVETIMSVGRVAELVVIGPLVDILDDRSPDSVGTLAESVTTDLPVDKLVGNTTGRVAESVVSEPSVERLIGGRTVTGCVGIFAGSVVIKPLDVKVPGMRTDLLVVRIESLVNKPLGVMLLGGSPDTLGKPSEPVANELPDVRLPGGLITRGSPVVPVVIGPSVERLEEGRPISLEKLGKMVMSEPLVEELLPAAIDGRPVPVESPVPALPGTPVVVKGYKGLTGVGSPPDGEVFLIMELEWLVGFVVFEVLEIPPDGSRDGSLVIVVNVLVPLVIILV